MNSRPRSFDWTLEPEAFGRFLARLDPDLEIAAERYERMRTKLVRLFEWRGCDFAEDLADRTIDRTIRKLQQDRRLDVGGEDLMRYLAGVARHIAQEYWRERQREQVSTEDAARPPFVPGKHTTTDLRLHHLDRALEQLGDEDRALILRYYPARSTERIQSRRQLAEELGLSTNTLRIRAYRLRSRLLELVRTSLGDGAAASTVSESRHR